MAYPIVREGRERRGGREEGRRESGEASPSEPPNRKLCTTVRAVLVAGGTAAGASAVAE
jgi:hypothetical protein